MNKNTVLKLFLCLFSMDVTILVGIVCISTHRYVWVALIPNLLAAMFFGYQGLGSLDKWEK